MQNSLEQHIKELAIGEVVMVQAPVESALEVNMNAIKALQDAGYAGVYITFFKDYLELSPLMEQKGIDVTRLAFVDGIAKLYGLAQAEDQNVIYIDGPLSTDAVVDNATKMLSLVKGDKKFIFLDSLTVVLLYNSLARTVDLVRSLSDVLKKERHMGIFTLVYRGVPNEAVASDMRSLGDTMIVLPRS